MSLNNLLNSNSMNEQVEETASYQTVCVALQLQQDRYERMKQGTHKDDELTQMHVQKSYGA